MSLLDEPTNIYIKYLNKATAVQSIGLHLDKSVEQLAEIIYNKDKEKHIRTNDDSD